MIAMTKKVPSPPTSLKFLIQDIPQDGFHLHYEVGQEELELTPDEGRILDCLHLDCDIGHSSEGIGVKGTLSGTLVRECVRCLGEYQELVVLPCLGIYQGDQSERQSSTVVLDEESYDSELEQIEEVYPCDDGQVDLVVLLREQIILATPIQRLCRPDCQGLCPRCGINRNDAMCSCVDVVEITPMVAALQKIKKNL